MKNNKQFAVIGLGRFGRAVVETLVASGYDVMGCDKNMEAVKQMEHIATDVMQLDVMNEDAMQYIGLNNFDVVIVAIGESLEASIMATMYAKEKGVNTCLDTSGNPFTVEEPFFGKFNELMKYTDLFMLDIKHIDDEEHKKLTGQTNKNILDMAQYLSKNGKKMWIRHVLVPGITTDERYLNQLREFIDTLKTVDRVEVLPYHTLGVFKWKELGIPYQLEGVEPPTKEQIECAKRILNCQN